MCDVQIWLNVCLLQDSPSRQYIDTLKLSDSAHRQASNKLLGSLPTGGIVDREGVIPTRWGLKSIHIAAARSVGYLVIVLW